MLLRNRHGSCRGEEAEVVVAVAVVVVMVVVTAAAAMAMMAAASSSLSGQTSQQLKAIVVSSLWFMLLQLGLLSGFWGRQDPGPWH